MKLTAGLIASLAGFATAAVTAAEVYLVPVREASSTTPSLTPGLARLVLLQRLASGGRGPAHEDVPKDVDAEKAMSVLNQFGKPPPPLFADGSHGEPSQLVLILEGMTENQIKDLGRALKMEPAFTVPNPPSDSAHEDLVKIDFHSREATHGNNCKIQQIFNPLEECWNGRQSAVAKYNIKKDPEILAQVSARLAQVSQLASIGELETTIVLLPSTTNSKSWSDQFPELRRRQAEQVMGGLEKTVPPAAPTSDTLPYTYRGPVTSCFNSEKSCIEATGNCSKHGSCQNKYAKPDGSDGKDVCYSCHCLGTRSRSGGLVHWAGPTCAKQDVSVAFWLFAGVTLALVGILSLAISMLFNVGQERLPGVIGAGVSKSK